MARVTSNISGQRVRPRLGRRSGRGRQWRRGLESRAWELWNLIFLLAPLVVVPLGMALGRAISGSGWCDSAASRLQPLGAALALVAMWLPPGRNAGLAAVGWMLVCVLLAAGGLVELIGTPWSDAAGRPFGRFRAGSEPSKGVSAPHLRLRRSIWRWAGLGWWLRGWGCGPWEFRSRSGC